MINYTHSYYCFKVVTSTLKPTFLFNCWLETFIPADDFILVAYCSSGMLKSHTVSRCFISGVKNIAIKPLVIIKVTMQWMSLLYQDQKVKIFLLLYLVVVRLWVSYNLIKKTVHHSLAIDWPQNRHLSNIIIHHQGVHQHGSSRVLFFLMFHNLLKNLPTHL